MESEAKALLKLWSIVFASLCYCYFIVPLIHKGIPRLVSLLPIFALFTILPLSLSSVLFAGITAFFITWLANFKLLLYAFNLGPLSSSQHRKLSLPKFLLISAFPIKVRTKYYPSRNVPLTFWSETVIFAILVGICDIYKGGLNRGLLLVIYCCMLYLFIDVVLGVSNRVMGSILGEDLLPPSDEPYLATSLRDFWGRRWNLMVTDMLRQTVFVPTRAFLSFYLGLRWASAAGVMAAFLVSGVMHELIFYYMARVSPTWEVTWFFVLHGVCVILEYSLKVILGRKLGLHWIVTGPLAVGFVMGTGYLWFFPPLLRNQLDIKAVEEVKSMYEFIKELFKNCHNVFWSSS